MKLTVKYFASIREALGQGGEAVETSSRATCRHCATNWSPAAAPMPRRLRAARRCAWR